MVDQYGRKANTRRTRSCRLWKAIAIADDVSSDAHTLGVQIANSIFFCSCLRSLHVYHRFLHIAKCDFSRWIDPPHERYIDRYVGTLWDRIMDLEYRMETLNEENNELRQQMQRERGNEEVVNIGSSYDPTCCCANPSCICACHYHDGQPRPRRPPQQFSMWVPRGSLAFR